MTIFLRDVLTDACPKGETPGKDAENEAGFRAVESRGSRGSRGSCEQLDGRRLARFCGSI